MKFVFCFNKNQFVWKGGGVHGKDYTSMGQKTLCGLQLIIILFSLPLTLLSLPLTLLATTYLCDSFYPSLIPADPALAMAVSLKHKL